MAEAQPRAGRMIETERLLLRPLAREDLDALVTVFADPEVGRFMSPFGADQAVERLRQDREDWARQGYGLMTILDRVSGEVLGRSGLRYWPEFGETEVGWVLRRDAWGRGYATEAARACHEWGFAHFDFSYITAMIDPRNARSIAVAERLKMKPLRDDVLLGDAIDVWAITRRDWGAADPSRTITR